MKLSFSIDRILAFLNKYYLWLVAAVFLILLAYNLCLYYQAVYSALNQPVDSVGSKLTVDQEVFDRVFENIKQREVKLEQVRQSQYPSPFAD